MDSDLQHPPEYIPMLIDKWREGFESVYAIREPDPSAPFLKKNFSYFFYKIFTATTKLNIPQNSADFRLLDRKIVLELRKFPEKNRFLRGIIYWTGYKTIGIKYQEAKRLHGETKYNLAQSFFLFIDAITSFSTTPLYIGIIVGFFIAIMGFLISSICLLYILFHKFTVSRLDIHHQLISYSWRVYTDYHRNHWNLHRQDL